MPEERSYTSAELFDAIVSVRDANAVSFDRVWQEFGRVRREFKVELGRLEQRIIRLDDRLVIERQEVFVRLEDQERRIQRPEG